MNCAWDELISLLPLWMRRDVDTIGKSSLQELRLRIGAPVQLVCCNGDQYLTRCANSDDIQFIINIASKYSPWTSQTISQGYITATGGHRIGVCGEAIVNNGVMTGVRHATSLCIRVARDFVGISKGFAFDDSSVLIVGAPGRGKTTLLRDLIRRYSSECNGSIAVLDERGEIFPVTNGRVCFSCGNQTDIMTNCSKPSGIQILLRTMGPSCIAVDEITLEADCMAILDAVGCGVKLFATAHAGSINDLKSRTVYRSLLNSRVFRKVLIMQPDKSWVEERM